MTKMHLRQIGFTSSARRPFTKIQERNKHFKEQKIHDIFIKTK